MTTISILAATIGIVAAMLLLACGRHEMRNLDRMIDYWKRPPASQIQPDHEALARVCYDEGVIATVQRLRDAFGCPPGDIWRILDTTDIDLSAAGRRLLERDGALPTPIAMPRPMAVSETG